ncbi:hypothetical protein K457DRAFT_140511 [Linnemannia elongata AG-77]|uniref:Uncharacterized protein n=1 Tax=Linnemannia elongata AG-77 TaxID=1314771 RepID=A0A197JN14_9FUNG|nr:hypothetical protein K457DRAFT_140511 [Linnemannia elongata AG-77]
MGESVPEVESTFHRLHMCVVCESPRVGSEAVYPRCTCRNVEGREEKEKERNSMVVWPSGQLDVIGWIEG